MELSHFSHEFCDIASQNSIHRCILVEYIALLIFKVKGPITRSPGHKTGRMGIEGVKSISILSQYMQSYLFSNKSNINIIYNISFITITITMSIILANFGKYAISDCLFICLSVCLSVCNVDDTSRTVRAINTKLGTYMYLGSGYMCIVLGVDDVIDDVIRFTNRSNFEIAITPSIFELERRTKS